ncbi:MAG: ComEA family DNA-binding protein [Bacteroidia bacterium]
MNRLNGKWRIENGELVQAIGDFEWLANLCQRFKHNGEALTEVVQAIGVIKKPLKHFTLFTIHFTLIFSSVFAQVDTSGVESVDQVIEDAISNTETEDQVDFTFLLDQLEDLKRHPVDLNRASREELAQIPGMDDLRITALMRHTQRFGALLTVYELQAVEGFDLEQITQMLPYIKVQSGAVEDMNTRRQYAKGPGLKEVLEGLKGEWTNRTVFLLEEQRGYTDPDTTFKILRSIDGDSLGQDTSLSSRYAGPNYAAYSRLRLRYGRYVSVAITAERDRGEAWRWDPKNQFFGFDFLSGHIGISEYGNLRSLVVGDYTMQFGQGLTLSRGLGFGKGADAVRTVKQPARGIRPYASVNENQFQRGIATTYAFGRLHMTGFFSRVRLDGSVQLRDTLTEEADAIGSIQLGGLHRTPSELENRRAIAETMYGGRAEWKDRSFSVGATWYQQRFSAELNPGTRADNQFAFRGDQNDMFSLDWDWVVRNVNFFGEIARSRSGGVAATTGILASLSPRFDVALSARSFDADFHSFKGYAFAERPIAIANEKGLYLGFSLKPNPRWTVSGYFDQFYYPTSKFQAFYPSNGNEQLLQIEYKPNRKTRAYIRLRADNKEVNARVLEPGQQLASLIPTRRLQGRFHIQTKASNAFTLRSRVELSDWQRGDEEKSKGFLLYQDVAWKPGFKFRFTGRFAIFDAQDYDARIYAYENDILGFFSIPPYSGQGTRMYGIIQYSPVRNIDIWVRYARTHRRDVVLSGEGYFNGIRGDAYPIFGSGLEQHPGAARDEIKLQVRFQF